MGAIKRLFVPFNDLRPDVGQFSNDGLVRATNVVPLAGDYAPSRAWLLRTAALTIGVPGRPYGLHVHPTAGGTSNNWTGYMGSVNLHEFSNTSAALWTVTDKTRLVGGNYTGAEVWDGASFGESVIMTNYADDPQLLTSPAAANFVKLALSGGANPGMDPKARFTFPIRGNLFLANLNLAAAFDTLPIGANPTVIAWSQTENVRQYGSFRVTPQLTGTGYQPLSYDFGYITGGIGGEYGMVSMQRGWVRVDGPPYVARPLSEGIGCIKPNSIGRFDDDVYFWGSTGPMVFRGGEGPAIPLSIGKLARTLADPNFAGGTFSSGLGANPMYTSFGADHINRSIWWAFTGSASLEDGGLIIAYAVDENRFSFIEPRKDGDPNTPMGAQFLRGRPEQLVDWTPGRDLVAIAAHGGSYYGATPYPSATSISVDFERAFQQYEKEFTTRIRRVRPIYSMSDDSILPSLTVIITSKNKPFQVATALTVTGTLDTHGWLPLPNCVYADFHGVRVQLQAIPSRLLELPGFEVEYEVGPPYSA